MSGNHTPENGCSRSLPLSDSSKLIRAHPDSVRAQPLDRNPAAVYLARLAPGSRRTMRGSLDAIARLLMGSNNSDINSGGFDTSIDTSPTCLTFPWERLTYAYTSAIRSRLAEAYAPATANKMLAALRGVLTECWRLGLMTEEERARASDLAPVRGRTLPKGRALSGAEIRTLLDACPETPGGKRDAALLGFLAGGGLRRSECVGLDRSDLEADGGLLIRRGKGAKDRRLYLPAWARELVDKWITVRGAEPGPLLMPVDRFGRVQRRRLSDQAVADALGRLGERAGVRGFAAHDMRRTYISHLLDAGADISTVQQLAGHSNPATTARYDRRGESAKKRAADLLRLG